MIPGITEIGFPSYATLHQATISLEEMGERTISTQVKIDGSVVPDFSGWKLEWRGELFVLPTLKPQASKDNTTRNALIDLVFTSSPIHELKRFFFAEMAEIEVGTIIINKYIASLRLSLTNFVSAFNKVLNYYFPAESTQRFVMNLNPSYVDNGEIKEFEIDYMYIWDVLMKMNEVYGVTWRSVTTETSPGRYLTTIRVGYDMGSIPATDHLFQYGFEGGLLRFERHVEDTDVYNILLGRGSDKNLPYRYYKRTDEYNPIWAADPDAIYELRNVFFDKLLDINFRWYVRGWMRNNNRDRTWNNAGYSYPTYTISSSSPYYWAYNKGRTDTLFDPVEYVKDDDSIALYGPRQGKLEDNDDIYPTIQGIVRPGLGRVDEIVGVYVTDEDSEEAVFDIVTDLDDVVLTVTYDEDEVYRDVFDADYTFTVPSGRVGNLEYAWYEDGLTPRSTAPTGTIDTLNSIPRTKKTDQHDKEYGLSGLPPGTYRISIVLRITRDAGYTAIQGNFGLKDITLHCTPADKLSYRQVFTVWVKNIWETTQGSNETELQYAHRVWDPILGDKLGKEAAIVFSDGWMSASSDYEFLIQKLPEVDRTKSITTKDENGDTITVASEWKITLVRSDAEFEATGLYIPNTKTGGVPVPGNHFFFTGIDIPTQYVQWAEERLNQTKEDSLTDKAWTNPTWVISLDKVKAHTESGDYSGLLADKLDAGVKVTITDPRFTFDQQRGEQVALTLGIRSVKFTWNEPTEKNPYTVPDIEVVLSDKIEHVESYQGVRNEITYISRNYATNASVKKMTSVQNIQTGVGIDGNICYFGTVIGTVEE